MSHSRVFRGTLLGLAVLFLLPFVTAATLIGANLQALKITGQALLIGGTLEGAQEKAVEKLMKKIEKAEEAGGVTQEAKYLKRIAGVVQTAGKAEDKGVDFGDRTEQLLASLREDAESRRGVATEVRDLLLSEKDVKAVDRQIDRGVAKFTAATGETVAAKKAKKYAQASKAFLKALGLGEKLYRKELEKGVISLSVTETSLDESAVLAPDGSIEVAFSLDVDPGSAGAPNVSITEFPPSDPRWPGQTFAVRVELQEPWRLVITPEAPLSAGTWFFSVLGQDSPNQDGVRAIFYPVVLDETLVLEFTVN